ncbi:hypothetical protein ACIQFZ_36805 [Streptomyces sp. NPDC093064]|uniref:hypothetical protein n=1 Tax=unclassified Streptomyces TaxID=2593676 RepID=UPI00344305CC
MSAVGSREARRIELGPNRAPGRNDTPCSIEGIGDGVPEDAAALWVGRLTQFDRLYTDSLYHGVLGPLLTFADQCPMEISWYLKQSRAGALPHQIRT